VRAVGDQWGTLEAAAGSRADLCCDPVAGEAEGARERQCPEVLYLARLDQAADCFIAGDAGAGKDGQHDGEPRPALGAGAAQRERDAQRDRRRGVAGVVDEVGKQRHAAGRGEHDGLGGSGDPKSGEREADGSQTATRALDRLIHKSVAVAVPCPLGLRRACQWPRAPRAQRVTMGIRVRVGVHPASMTVRDGVDHGARAT